MHTYKHIHTYARKYTLSHTNTNTCCCGDAISGHPGKRHHHRKLCHYIRWYRIQMHTHTDTPMVRSYWVTRCFVRSYQSLVICKHICTNICYIHIFHYKNSRCDTTVTRDSLSCPTIKIYILYLQQAATLSRCRYVAIHCNAWKVQACPQASAGYDWTWVTSDAEHLRHNRRWDVEAVVMTINRRNKQRNLMM